MAKGKRGRHARRTSWRQRVPVPSTAVAIVGLGVVFLSAGALAVHILNVPSHLRQEGVAGPAAAPGRSTAATARVRPGQSRAARAANRTTPTPTPTPRPTPTARQRVASPAKPAAASPSSSAPQSPRPSPSSSSGGPLPLPTLTAADR